MSPLPADPAASENETPPAASEKETPPAASEKEMPPVASEKEAPPAASEEETPPARGGFVDEDGDTVEEYRKGDTIRTRIRLRIDRPPESSGPQTGPVHMPEEGEVEYTEKKKKKKKKVRPQNEVEPLNAEEKYKEKKIDRPDTEKKQEPKEQKKIEPVQTDKKPEMKKEKEPEWDAKERKEEWKWGKPESDAKERKEEWKWGKPVSDAKERKDEWKWEKPVSDAKERKEEWKWERERENPIDWAEQRRQKPKKEKESKPELKVHINMKPCDMEQKDVEPPQELDEGHLWQERIKLKAQKLRFKQQKQEQRHEKKKVKYRKEMEVEWEKEEEEREKRRRKMEKWYRRSVVGVDEVAAEEPEVLGGMVAGLLGILRRGDKTTSGSDAASQRVRVDAVEVFEPPVVDLTEIEDQRGTPMSQDSSNPTPNHIPKHANIELHRLPAAGPEGFDVSAIALDTATQDRESATPPSSLKSLAKRAPPAIHSSRHHAAAHHRTSQRQPAKAHPHSSFHQHHAPGASSAPGTKSRLLSAALGGARAKHSGVGVKEEEENWKSGSHHTNTHDRAAAAREIERTAARLEREREVGRERAEEAAERLAQDAQKGAMGERGKYLDHDSYDPADAHVYEEVVGEVLEGTAEGWWPDGGEVENEVPRLHGSRFPAFQGTTTGTLARARTGRYGGAGGFLRVWTPEGELSDLGIGLVIGMWVLLIIAILRCQRRRAYVPSWVREGGGRRGVWRVWREGGRKKRYSFDDGERDGREKMDV